MSGIDIDLYDTRTNSSRVFLSDGHVSQDTGKQGRSQPHSPGWARVPLSSFFPKF